MSDHGGNHSPGVPEESEEKMSHDFEAVFQAMANRAPTRSKAVGPRPKLHPDHHQRMGYLSEWRRTAEVATRWDIGHETAFNQLRRLEQRGFVQSRMNRQCKGRAGGIKREWRAT